MSDESYDMKDTPAPQSHVEAPASMLEDGSPLVTDLIREFERARRQWDEFQKTGVSTAAVGSYDLCFSPILKKHLAAKTQDIPAVKRLRRALNASHPNHKTICVFVEDVRALLNPPPQTREDV